MKKHLDSKTKRIDEWQLMNGNLKLNLCVTPCLLCGSLWLGFLPQSCTEKEVDNHNSIINNNKSAINIRQS